MDNKIDILKKIDTGIVFNIKIKDILELKNQSQHYNAYINDFALILDNIKDKNKELILDSDINLKFGDNTQNYEELYFSKACKIGDNNCILLPLNITRHYANLNKILIYDNIKFINKKPKIFWRGATTNYKYDLHKNISILDNPRLFFVKNYYDNNIFDIGFNKLCQSVDKYDYIHNYIKDTKTIYEMLEYKYLLSLEGNDVATNLKWILCSNSICFMPKPTKITYFREDLLIPDVNYIEIDETNIIEKYEFCENNPDFCEKIIENNKNLMSEFLKKNLYEEGAKILEDVLLNE